MKTTVEITDRLFEQAKALALNQGISFRVLVEEGLRAVIEARTSTATKTFRLRDGSFRNSEGLRTGLKWTDITALAYENEGGSLLP